MPKKKTTEQFIQEAQEIHGDWYDYSLVEYENATTPVVIICPIHGKFEQKPAKHLKTNGCRKCSNKEKLTKERFVEKAIGVHGNFYDYSQVEYQTSQTKVTIVCPIHGEFQQKPNNHLNGNGCPHCAFENRKMTLNRFIEKAREVHGDWYSYDHVDYVNNRTKVNIVCPTHGSFWQLSNVHLNGHGCPKCKGDKVRDSKSSTTEEFKEKAREVHGNKYDYSKVDYVNRYTKIEIVCLEHGSFWQTPNIHLNGHGCSRCTMGFQKYNLNQWVKEETKEHYDPCNIYLIEMYNENERFLKLGITIKKVKYRYKSKTETNSYQYKNILELLTTKKKAVLAELQAKEKLDDYVYVPCNKFAGWTECFSLEAKDDLLGIIKEINK